MGGLSGWYVVELRAGVPPGSLRSITLTCSSGGALLSGGVEPLVAANLRVLSAARRLDARAMDFVLQNPGFGPTATAADVMLRITCGQIPTQP